jgi:hypothetical protein
MKIADHTTTRFILLSAVLCLCVSACGQTVKLLGEVVDASGAPVPNARVLLIDLNSLEVRRTSSDDKGAFEFSGLTLTPYEIKAACRSFVTGSAKVLELVDKGPVILTNPPLSVTLNATITLSVKSSP